MPEDVFLASPRKAPANRRSVASLRGPTSLAGALDTGDDAGNANGRFSLAHELAVAMMPEPSAGSKLLAEEFGIEFDEGAEGIDEPGGGGGGPQINIQDGDLSFAESDPHLDSSFGDGPPGSSPTRPQRRAPPEQDAMEVLAENLQSTDNFLLHLRRLDADSSAPSSSSASAHASSSSQPALERLASDVIRRINDTARDREGQVRALVEYEREFRRIAGEVGGQDVLGQLDALPVPEEDPVDTHAPPLGTISEEEPASASASPTRRHHSRAMSLSQDWETDPDFRRLGDADADTDPAYDGRDDDDNLEPPVSPSPVQTTFSPSIPGTAPSAARAREPAAQLADLRGLTTSLIASLTSVSEHAQVNGAATAEAGRKIRALRNRLGGWRTEWEGAERSRGRIERWEAGEAWESGDGTGTNTPTSGTPVRGAKRVNARQVVQEHLTAFERALADAAVKTNAIMAAS
ncbi:hypothetical protein GGX14DRAFT_625573 [Mycena pura]|uniref:Uncharacterized protein n=1 Tax=Mycena pura TaxID=153505 RepID=A0AAD6YDE7_9AGAR|nr:hypothetical protein GGX14DRAFT_625573 [Mycena pura]